MITFKAVIEQFQDMGEKTGWRYIRVPAAASAKLQPGRKTSFRVKGFLDEHPIEGVALIPMGEGEFIIAINAQMRKAVRKQKGATLSVRLELDEKPFVICADLMESLQDEPKALAFFKTLPPGHQRYFSKWIDSAKTEPTRVKRIAQAVNALSRSLGYSGMLRALKAEQG
ncbi:YdeI/OmpD-associated family protein [Dinghuibacter silviterrae]|uniref:Bacteriocin resistance YdeI/OmpD-like protein n=1 Tax=Dinghuibacter silviterrae TaxID=1539049 RepID=A0A4R8DRI5_9BACT|nr:YdeI/OmpD-associated family protein [Dinghuibacter silviterrae]TDX00446.1 bacteriocin resistance YdeI/OmpD-like protein [Dinghuibacter silviterrae]